jgi:hypothetical protein
VDLWWSFIAKRLGVRIVFIGVRWRCVGARGVRGVSEGNLAVAPSAALRPSAERYASATRVFTWGFAPGWYVSGRWLSFGCWSSGKFRDWG